MTEEWLLFANGSPTTRHIYDPEKERSACGQVAPTRTTDGEVYDRIVIAVADSLEGLVGPVRETRNVCGGCLRALPPIFQQGGT